MIDPVAAWSQATHSPSLVDQNAHSCQRNQRKPLHSDCSTSNAAHSTAPRSLQTVSSLGHLASCFGNHSGLGGERLAFTPHKGPIIICSLDTKHTLCCWLQARHCVAQRLALEHLTCNTCTRTREQQTAAMCMHSSNDSVSWDTASIKRYETRTCAFKFKEVRCQCTAACRPPCRQCAQRSCSTVWDCQPGSA
jgi:hypothetical protein